MLVLLYFAVAAGCAIEGHRDGYFTELVEYGERLNCSTVVLTVVFGGVHTELQSLPVGRHRQKHCNVAAVDSYFVRSASDAHWTVVVTRPPFAFGPRDSRVPKILAHLFFPRAKFIVYVDANRRLLEDPDKWRAEFFDADPAVMLLVERHAMRSTFKEEHRSIYQLNYDHRRVIDYQQWMYSRDNVPLKNLTLGSFRMQRASTLTSVFACAWFDHFMHHSQRDQLALVRVINELDLVDRRRMVMQRYGTFATLPANHSREYTVTKSSPTAATCRMRYKLHCDSPRQWFFDMGANHGQSIIYAASRIRSGLASWNLVTAEPNPEMHRYVQRVLTSTKTASTVFLKEAAWDKRRSTNFYISNLDGDRETQGSLLAEKKNTNSNHSYTVQTFSLSDYIRDHVADFEFLLLKLDVEGAEYDILRQMIDSGTILLVDLLAIEFHDGRVPLKAREGARIRQELSDLGVPIMSKWDALHSVGWDAKTYDAARFRWKTELALRRQKA